ncbi:hypothetical protein BB691_06760 [Listeria monocytogenes]|nr:hypothetical protein AUZ28_13130 [Listeria monocytogenes]EXL23582.1 hypothetical protein X847_1395 [Listeria monocytogenes Lm_1889]KHK08675.1 TraC-F family protein [Listeria monocytogenes SHL004]PIL09078.1 hypothetical protein P732_01405 [Listeria monocytogenes SHL015]CDM16354.1 protein of unknown function [Listeria monocytogenes R479a]
MLDPYVILKKPKDSENLAIDILTFLTGIFSRDSDKFPILIQNNQLDLLLVIDKPRSENSIISNSIADQSKVLWITILHNYFLVMVLLLNQLASKINSILFK